MLVSYIKRGANATFFYAFSSFLSRGISFLFLPYFLSQLTLTEFGIWDFYQAFFSTGTLVLSSCASISLFRFYILYKDDSLKQKQSLGNSLLCILLASCLFVCVAAISLIFKQSSFLAHTYLYLTIINISFFSLFSLVLSFLRVKEKLLLYTLAFCGQNFIALAGTVLGVINGYGISSFFYANLVSFMLFVPFFIVLFLRNRYFSWDIFTQQFHYSFPMLLYSFIYTMFFTVDKFFLKTYLGFETLGIYGLLWRFGSIFQMITIAMIDAWALIIYNAQKEVNGNTLISRLITYYALALTTFSLYSVVIAGLTIQFLFPAKYSFLIKYLPLFFLPMIFIECARLFQTIFGLAIRTWYIPILSTLVLSLQTLLLFYSVSFNLWGIFLANSVAFLIYAILCYLASLTMYSYRLINKEKLSKIFILFTTFTMVLHGMFMERIMALLVCSILFLWPLVVWFSGIIDAHEKEWVTSKITLYFYIIRGKTSLFKKNK